VIGTWINVAGIIIGGILGLTRKTPLSLTNQFFFKAILGAFTVFVGLRLTWISLNGSFAQIAKQLAIVLVALTLGRLTGKLLHLQKASNRVGHFAREKMAAVARPDNTNRFSDGFAVCAALFCAAPLGILGAIHDGISGYYFPLMVKALMDGLATLSFVSMFGTGVVLSAVPVFVFQGTISLLCARFLVPFLQAHQLIDPINATGGLLVFCVALIIFEVKKIEVTDYLPSLLFAPLITWWLR
jgi:uncharacterized membrane protein YqgA involved in biofilm formation